MRVDPVQREGPDERVAALNTTFGRHGEVTRLDGGAIRREHHDATHVCSAQRFGPPEAPFQLFDDDGEPSGTAGRPILAAIAGAGIFDAVVAVVRYYGGVKLGTGGLARAYGDAAKQALATADPKIVWRHVTFRAACRYDDVGAVEAVLARSGGALVDVDRRFDDAPTLAITARRSRARRIADEIVEATAGRATIDSWSEEDR